MPVIHARFGEFNHGDDNGPCGYSICVSLPGSCGSWGDRHHVRVVDETRFGGEVELAYAGICDQSCCTPHKEFGCQITQMLCDPEHKSVMLAP